ncbi:hypothetical protein [Leptolyngbya sp. NIES-2104]|uniref:hypothetical protein n=1 Tax=Leptolyngbya sp. NIES-2104 TaxID=1552121 RepID=UPI0006EC5316|nr:hypothetical protein [Leptolyngbya sp. NIES-2104]GAP96324.1 hypothetical protein NIES2104_28590 [Leptolyngbya sp. NIES-2104]
MNISENPTNADIRDALLQLSEKVEQLDEKFDQKFESLSEKVDRLDYRFDVYQKGTDAMVRMATTIIIAAASVLILSNLSPAITKVVTALTTN